MRVPKLNNIDIRNFFSLLFNVSKNNKSLYIYTISEFLFLTKVEWYNGYKGCLATYKRNVRVIKVSV